MKIIVYISQAMHWMGSHEVSELVDRSSDSNRALGVTGLLLFDGRRFMQVIEGDDDVMDRLMARIRADRRHHAVDVVIERESATRYFAEWSLMYQNTVPGTDLERFRTTLKRNVAGVLDPAVQALLIGFANLGHAQPARRLDRSILSWTGPDRSVPDSMAMESDRSGRPPN